MPGYQYTPGFRKNSSVMLTSPAGHGSAATCIRRFGSTVWNNGGDYTITDSATAGTTVTVLVPGVYSISYQDSNSLAACKAGISVNTVNPSTAIDSVLLGNGKRGFGQSSAAGFYSVFSTTLYLSAGDRINAHTDGTPDNVSTNAILTITRCA